MAKGPFILAVAAALAALVWMWPSDSLVPPSTPPRSEQDDVDDSTAAAVERVAVALPEPAPPPELTKPAEEAVAPKPVVEPRPDWINEDKFVEAGLTLEQAAELAGGMRRLRDEKIALGKDAKWPKSVIGLHSLIMLDLGPTLAERIKDGAISMRWTPRVTPGPEFNSFSLDMTGSAEPLLFCAHGRVGAVSLGVPRKLCNQELLVLLVAAGDAK